MSDGIVLTWPALFTALATITTVIAAVWRVMDASVRNQTGVLNKTVAQISADLLRSHEHIEEMQACSDARAQKMQDECGARIDRAQAENDARLKRMREEYSEREAKFNADYEELKRLLQESERKHIAEMRSAQAEIDDLRKRVDALTASYNTERDLRMRAEAEAKLLRERITVR